MEVGMEMEDDVFFADLNRQISLLIMDDDEDPNAHCPSASLQVLHHLLLFSQFNYKKKVSSFWYCFSFSVVRFCSTPLI